MPDWPRPGHILYVFTGTEDRHDTQIDSHQCGDASKVIDFLLVAFDAATLRCVGLGTIIHPSHGSHLVDQ